MPAYQTALLSRADNLHLLQLSSENNALLQQMVETENTTPMQLAEEVPSRSAEGEGAGTIMAIVQP